MLRTMPVPAKAEQPPTLTAPEERFVQVELMVGEDKEHKIRMLYPGISLLAAVQQIVLARIDAGVAVLVTEADMRRIASRAGLERISDSAELLRVIDFLARTSENTVTVTLEPALHSGVYEFARGNNIPLGEAFRRYLDHAYANDWWQGNIPEVALLITVEDLKALKQELGGETLWDARQVLRLVRGKLSELAEHRKAVGEFLSEMYATMVDPLSEETMKVAEICKTLLEAARAAREELPHLKSCEAAVPLLEKQRDELQQEVTRLTTLIQQNAPDLHPGRFQSESSRSSST